MRIHLTVLRAEPRRDPTRADADADREPIGYDVEVRAPAGTLLGELHPALAAEFGAEFGVEVSAETGADSVEAIDQGRPIWAGSRALPRTAVVGGPGLRSGCVLGLGTPRTQRRNPATVLALHVVGGPDAGLIAGLARGSVRIGRGPECEVRLTDADVSRRHLELSVTAQGLSIRDLGSTNGASLLPDDDATPTAIDGGATELAIGRYVSVGETVLCVASVNSPAAATSLDDAGGLTVNRPPRLVSELPPRELAFEPDPRVTRPTGLPWLAAIIPAAGGAALAWFMHNPQFLAFALLSPVLMLGTSVGDRVSGRGGRRRERASARIRAATLAADTTELTRHETAFRRSAHPDPAALFLAATTPDLRVWERRPTDADFLDIRFGLADQPATFTRRQGGQCLSPPILAAVPLIANLRRGTLGVCGPRPPALALVRWIVAQLGALHSPADLRLAAILDGDPDGEDDASETWSWLRWLPHLGDGPDRSAAIARTHEQRRVLVARLNALIDIRQDRRGAHTAGWGGPWTVVIIDRAARQADIAGIGRLLRDGPSVGVTAVCLDDAARRLPPACTSVAGITGATGTRVHVATSTGTDTEALADQVSLQWAEDVVRALAPLRDPEASDASTLPNTVRLLDLIEGGLDENCVRTRWSAGSGRARALLGVCGEGRFEIDLERDGPHTLIAGTTGAGKSELLQTLVAGLALQAGPDDLQFVLIDYKGGAAFAECAELPHTSGLVTDLDSHLTERALRSLHAELTRRESLFATVGAKDLSGYRRSAGAGLDRLARLVMVVDEFAALAEELPDFVTGLVGIAQRGRSLGVHLVLATQRPGSVVSPEIRANTALRIALRVTDPAESGDVVGCDDAALIGKETPGRAVVRLGTTLVAVQTARIAGRPPPHRAPISIRRLDGWGQPLTDDDQVRIEDRSGGEPPTDLAELVDALRSAARTTPAVRRPWLDPLPDIIDADTLTATIPDRFRVAFARQDLPDQQRQPADHLDLGGGGSLLLVGGPRSGRSSALRVIAARAALQLPCEELQLQVLDCAGGSMRGLGELPHCASLLTRAHATSIDRLLRRLDEEVSRRQAVLAELGLGTAAEARAAGRRLPAILLLLDGWEGFVAATEDVDAGRPVDTLLHLLREGSAAGLTIVISGDRAALATRLSSAVQRRLVLRLVDPDDYAIAGLSRRSVPGRMPPGRALDSADGTECQFAVLGPDPGTGAQLARVSDLAGQLTAAAPSHRLDHLVVRALPSRVRLVELAAERIESPAGCATTPAGCATTPAAATGAVVIGAGGDSASALAIPVLGAELRFVIAGPARSGRSTALMTMAGQLVDQRAQVVLAAGSRSPLRESAATRGVPVLGPESRTLGTPVYAPGIDATRPVVLLIDDVELFADTVVGDWIMELIRTAPAGLSILATARSDDLAVAYRGIGAELRRSRRGLLLRPGPGDGDLFGAWLPLGRRVLPVGRGYLVADDLIVREEIVGASTTGPVEIQVALP